jgi:peptide/nickel transport system substrate-binding protein
MLLRKRSFLFVLLLTLLAVGLAGVQAQDDPQPGGSLTFAFSSDWGTLDPAATAVTFARNIMQFIFDPLLRTHPETGEIVPGLAEAYEVSDDGTVITLTLRSGVIFHDGTPLTSEVVQFSLDRITDPELNSPMAAQITGNVATIETPDELTVVITLNEPFAPFLDSLTQVSLAPVSPAAVEELGADFGQSPVGTGPFRFVSTVPDEQVVLARNDDYAWAPDYYDNQGPPYLDELIVLNVPEASTRMALIETAEIDLVYNPISGQVAFFEDDPDFYVQYATRAGVPRVFVLNTEMPPMDDPVVRNAIAWAIDRERILSEVFSDIGEVARGVITPGLLGYWAEGEDQWPDYDLDRAAELLDEAGWELNADGLREKDGETLSLTYGQIPGFPFDQYAQIVNGDLARLGIEVSIENQEQAAYLADMRAGRWHMTGMLFAATDPDVLFIIAHSSSIDEAWNTARYNNSEVDALIEAGRVTLDQEARAGIYREIQQIMAEELPYVPFYLIQNPHIITSRVQGFRTDSQAFLDFYETYIVD